MSRKERGVRMEERSEIREGRGVNREGKGEKLERAEVWIEEKGV